MNELYKYVFILLSFPPLPYKLMNVLREAENIQYLLTFTYVVWKHIYVTIALAIPLLIFNYFKYSKAILFILGLITFKFSFYISSFLGCSISLNYPYCTPEDLEGTSAASITVAGMFYSIFALGVTVIIKRILKLHI